MRQLELELKAAAFDILVDIAGKNPCGTILSCRVLDLLNEIDRRFEEEVNES